MELAERAVLEAGDMLTKYTLSFTDAQKADGDPHTLWDELVGFKVSCQLEDSTGLKVYTENYDNPEERMQEGSFWWVDPIDGTRSMTHGENYFSISAGLIVHGEPVVGAVYQPKKRILLSAFKDGGAFVKAGYSNQRRLAPKKPVVGRVKAARGSGVDIVAESMYKQLGVSLMKPTSSFTYKVSLVGLGKAHLYIKPNIKCNEHDSAAVDIWLHERGGYLTDLFGNRLGYNKEDPRHRKGTVASNGIDHSQVISQLREHFDLENLFKE